jgi:hypothetical protein
MPKFDTPAHEAVIFELRKVPRGGQPLLTIASRDFTRGECQSSILHLMKPRVARGVSTWALADDYIQRALTSKGGPTCIAISGIRSLENGAEGL